MGRTKTRQEIEDAMFPIRRTYTLGDGNWDKRVITVLFNEDGTFTWDAESYKREQQEALDMMFGPKGHAE